MANEIIRKQMSYKEQSKWLGGPIGLLKSFCTRGAHEIADDAVNIFGGRGITQSGMGKLVEQFHRSKLSKAPMTYRIVRFANLNCNQHTNLMLSSEVPRKF